MSQETSQFGRGPVANWLLRNQAANRFDDGRPGSRDSESMFWGGLVDTAIRHGLAGLFQEELQRQNVAIPMPFESRLRTAALATAAANFQIELGIRPPLNAFQCRGIPVMLLKGVALIQDLYPRPDLRPMSDADLLVRERDAHAAIAALESTGYRRGSPLIRDDFFPRYHNEMELFSEKPPRVRIDLHARPFRPLPFAGWIREDEWWRGARPIPTDGITAYLPSIEKTLIHLAGHAAVHGYSRPLWLYDIHRLMCKEGDELDWDQVLSLSRRWRLQSAVRGALERAEHHFGPCVPHNVRQRLSSSRTGFRERLILAQAPRDAASPLSHVAVNLICTPGLRKRIGYLAAMMVPNGSHLSGFYGRRHFGWQVFAHIIRLFRIVRNRIRFGALPRRAEVAA